MLVSFLNFLGLDTEETKSKQKPMKWQVTEKKHFDKKIFNVKNTIYKQIVKIEIDYEKGQKIKIITTKTPLSNHQVKVETKKEYKKLKGY